MPKLRRLDALTNSHSPSARDVLKDNADALGGEDHVVGQGVDGRAVPQHGQVIGRKAVNRVSCACVEDDNGLLTRDGRGGQGDRERARGDRVTGQHVASDCRVVGGLGLGCGEAA